METLSIIVLIMLMMVGYSSGITLAAKGKSVPLSLWDLLLVFVLWVVALRTRPEMVELLGDSRLAHFLLLLTWIGITLIIGYIKTAIAHSNSLDDLPETELPEHAQVETVESDNPFRRAWERWKLFAAKMGHVQGGIFMGFFYFIVVTIFGLGTRIFTDPMALKTTPAGSGWVERKPLDATLEQAREQGQTD